MKIYRHTFCMLILLLVVGINVSCSDDSAVDDEPVKNSSPIETRTSTQQTYPSVSEIVKNAAVQTAMEAAWSKMKSSASSSERSEYGFYIYYDSSSKEYTCGSMVQGPITTGCEGTNASVSLGKVTNNLTVCAFFHCHTTLQYCPSTVSRETGPSTSDKNFATQNKLPGILYDYKVSVLAGGTSKDAAYKTYTFGPKRRTL